MTKTKPDICTNNAWREATLALAWSGDTSADKDNWSEDKLSYGQCAVTALIVQDMYGGELLRCMAEGASHYYNRLPDGTLIDYTQDQFSTMPDYENSETRTREYVLSHPSTASRYRLLQYRLDQIKAAL